MNYQPLHTALVDVTKRLQAECDLLLEGRLQWTLFPTTEESLDLCILQTKSLLKALKLHREVMLSTNVRTRNDLPQGGSHEKSVRTPRRTTR